MNKDPESYTEAVKARANLAVETFTKPNVESYYYDKGSNEFTIPLFPALNVYINGSVDLWAGSSESNRLSFVTGNIGSKAGEELVSDVNGSINKFGQGPGFNFTDTQMRELGLDFDTVIQNQDAVPIPISVWRKIFKKYGAVYLVANSSLGAMITSLRVDQFFNQNKYPKEDEKKKYKGTNWSNERATLFMSELSDRLMLKNQDKEDILKNYKQELESLVNKSGYSQKTVELIHQPLKNLREKHKEEEVKFLEIVNEQAIEMLEKIDCTALEYDGLVVHCALLCMYYKSEGMEYNFNNIKNECQRFHQDIVLWSVDIPEDPPADEEHKQLLSNHIDKLLSGGDYIKKTYKEILFYHDLGLDPNVDDFIAINLLIKALNY